LAAISGLSEPVGALVGYGVMVAVDDFYLMYGIMFGIVAGMMVFISIQQLLPTAHQYGFFFLKFIFRPLFNCGKFADSTQQTSMSRTAASSEWRSWQHHSFCLRFNFVDVLSLCITTILYLSLIAIKI